MAKANGFRHLDNLSDPDPDSDVENVHPLKRLKLGRVGGRVDMVVDMHETGETKEILKNKSKDYTITTKMQEVVNTQSQRSQN